MSVTAQGDVRAPEVVFHGAALKHLPLLKSHPLEAWKTAEHLLWAAAWSGGTRG